MKRLAWAVAMTAISALMVLPIVPEDVYALGLCEETECTMNNDCTPQCSGCGGTPIHPGHCEVRID